jgi:hypothetical protein
MWVKARHQCIWTVVEMTGEAGTHFSDRCSPRGEIVPVTHGRTGSHRDTVMSSLAQDSTSYD